MSFNLNSYLDREPIKTFLRSMAGVINYIRILNIQVEIPGEPSEQTTPVTGEVTNLTAPVIAVQGGGNAEPTAILEVTPGTWTGSPTLTYQWYNSEFGIIFGETGTTYTIQDDDRGRTIYVREIPNGLTANGVNSNSQYILEDYSILSNVVFHGDFNGLVVGQNNDYGEVDGSGNIVTWKSSPQFPTGVTFGVQGTAPTLTDDGIVFTSSGNLRHTGAASVFEFMHYHASGINSLKWTVIAVMQHDSSDRVVGILGNNGSSLLSKGMSLFIENRSSQNGDLNIRFDISRGVTNSYILRANLPTANPKTIPMACFNLLCLEVDNSLTTADRGKVFTNTARRGVEVQSNSTTLAATPTYNLEIGAVGNAVLRGQQIIKEIFILSGVLSEANRNSIMLQLNNKYNLTRYYGPYEQDLGYFEETGRYKFNLSLNVKAGQTENDLIALYTDGTSHVYSSQKKIVKRTSNDRGLTWSAQSDVYVPSAPNAVQDPGTGYDSNGRLHILAETITSTSPGSSTPALKYLYSDDDGDTWSAVTDLTSILPSDSLAAYRVYGKMVESNGRIMFPLYKQTDEGTTTESANYMIYSDDYGANWSYKTIRAKSATYINETSLHVLEADKLIAISRNESTLEWTYFSSTDNGDTWSNDGDVTFGLTMATTGHPVRISKFNIGAVEFTVFFTSARFRTGSPMYINVCRTSELISSGKAAIKNNLTFGIQNKSLTSDDYLNHYGDIHFINQNPDLGVMFSPADNPFQNVPNRLYYYQLPNYWIDYVKEEYGLSC